MRKNVGSSPDTLGGDRKHGCYFPAARSSDQYRRKDTKYKSKVKSAPIRLDGYRSQLDSLISTLRLVEDEPELQTLAIQEQIQLIVKRGKDVQDQLDATATRLSKCKAKQYAHVITAGDREGRALDDVMALLDRAKADLTTRIITAHVGLTGDMRTGFTIGLAAIQRVDQNVQKVLNQRLSIAVQLDAQNAGEFGTVGNAHFFADANKQR